MCCYRFQLVFCCIIETTSLLTKLLQKQGDASLKQCICFKAVVMKLLGQGVFATTDVCQCQFLAQYHGELVSEREGEQRERKGETEFHYFFQHGGIRYW